MRKVNMLLGAICFLLALLLLLPPAASAQATEETEGKNSGNYNVKQTFEFGGRITDRSGNRNTYSTFVNLKDGVRLFEHSLELRSLNHQGWLFDSFSVNSFGGYGGDPNNVTRLRAYKNKWYNFAATFRRDVNFWDYNLLANPLNPSTPFVNAPAGFNPVVLISPHRMETVRRMTDYDLTILPQSRVRFRLGYSRNISEGPSYTSFHEGTDILLFQDWKTTLNSYRIGVDFKLLPRTNISFDQFFQYFKGDTSWRDQNFTFQLSNGMPVDLGLIFNAAASQPCAGTFLAAPAGAVNPACNGYLSYTSAVPMRSDYPTSQITFQSSYFRDFDFSARLAYSSSDSTGAFTEDATGLVTRTRQRAFNISGPVENKRVAVTADFAATWQATEKLHFSDTFHFNNFRLPGQWLMNETSLFGTSMLVAPNIFTPGAAPPAGCPTITSAGCPQHNASSPADVMTWLYDLYLAQDSKTNTFEVRYNFAKEFGLRVGHRYRTRDINERDFQSATFLFFPTLPNRRLPAPFSATTPTCPVANNLPDGSCRVSVIFSDSEEVQVHENSALVGIWARPNDQWRFSLDMELFSADRSFTRISPRQFQNYKFRASFKPVEWASIAGTVAILEARNNVVEINHLRHNRAYAFSVVLAPDETWSVDFGYDYTDVFSQTNICYTIGSGPLPPGSTPCPAGGLPLSGISLYTNKTHFGHVDFMFRPVKRVTASLGYNGNNTSGDTTFLSPTAPQGPLQINYHQPYGMVLVEIAKGFAGRFGWRYYNYGEKAPVDATGPRDFRTNLVTLSLRYAF